VRPNPERPPRRRRSAVSAWWPLAPWVPLPTRMEKCAAGPHVDAVAVRLDAPHPNRRVPPPTTLHAVGSSGRSDESAGGEVCPAGTLAKARPGRLASIDSRPARSRDAVDDVVRYFPSLFAEVRRSRATVGPSKSSGAPPPKFEVVTIISAGCGLVRPSVRAVRPRGRRRRSASLGASQPPHPANHCKLAICPRSRAFAGRRSRRREPQTGVLPAPGTGRCSVHSPGTGAGSLCATHATRPCPVDARPQKNRWGGPDPSSRCAVPTEDHHAVTD